jgi:allantoin racemase
MTHPPRRILVINPNTNPAVTERVRAAAARLATADVRIDVVNPAQGPFSIEGPAERDEAERHVLALIRERRAERHDAYVLACFDDLALDEARALVSVPVVGTCESGIAAARAVSPRFAIVTTVHAAVPGIRELMRRFDAGDQASVRAAGIGVAEAADADADARRRIAQAVREAVVEDGAQAILLASGGLTGQADAVAREAGLPVIDGVVAAIERAVALVTPRRPRDA